MLDATQRKRPRRTARATSKAVTVIVDVSTATVSVLAAARPGRTRAGQTRHDQQAKGWAHRPDLARPGAG